jgi:hypothetical protein
MIRKQSCIIFERRQVDILFQIIQRRGANIFDYYTCFFKYQSNIKIGSLLKYHFKKESSKFITKFMLSNFISFLPKRN